MEIPRGRRVKESMALKWNSKEGGGFTSKNLPWEGYGYFLEQHNA